MSLNMLITQYGLTQDNQMLQDVDVFAFWCAKSKNLPYICDVVLKVITLTYQICNSLLVY